MVSIFQKGELSEYIDAHSTALSPFLEECIAITKSSSSAPQMLSSPSSGEMLKIFVTSLRAKNILEVGTFTGFATLKMAEGMPPEGKIVTLEYSKEHRDIAQSIFDRSPWKHQIEIKLGDAKDFITQFEDNFFDFIFIDADKRGYPFYYRESLKKVRPGGMIVVDNCLWDGLVVDPVSTQDLQTKAICETNVMIKSDGEQGLISHVMIPLKDGLHVVVKNT